MSWAATSIRLSSFLSLRRVPSRQSWRSFHQSWFFPSVVAFSSSVVAILIIRDSPSSVVVALLHRSCRRWYPYLIHTHSCAGLSGLAEWAGFFDAALPASPKVLARGSASSNPVQLRIGGMYYTDVVRTLPEHTSSNRISFYHIGYIQYADHELALND